MSRCHKAYEAIEVGNPVNAITDLSGAICEHFTTQPDAPPSHFHMMYKASVNRSLIVGIRSMRILKVGLTPTRPAPYHFHTV